MVHLILTHTAAYSRKAQGGKKKDIGYKSVDPVLVQILLAEL